MKCQCLVLAVSAVVAVSAHLEGSSNVDGDIVLPNFPPLPLPTKDFHTAVPATFQVPVIRNTNQPATPPPSPPLNPSPQKRESASISSSQDTFKEALTGTISNSTEKNLSINSTDGKKILSATTPPSHEQVKELSSTAVTTSSTSQDTFREVIIARNTGSSSSEVNSGEGLENTANSQHSGSFGEVKVSTGGVRTPAAGTSTNSGGNDGGGGVVAIPRQNGDSGAVVTNRTDTSAASRVAASILPILAATVYAAL
ncbi:hypothetical protein P3T76_003843 [Phytophthora citrophthora]|uniref:RxLR effector protein n=1 Tax=Phytophthora citrophthora TaxID=4793 RepID=A0AAD9GUS9_9STRA|nr:hypothetical protein P3T76_003843 [Phytophthora citrophthora]